MIFKKNISFKKKIFFTVFSIILGSVISFSLFFIHLFKKDKINQVSYQQKSTLTQASSHITNLINFAGSINVDQIGDNSDILFAFDDACDPHKVRGSLSNYYSEEFKKLNIRSSDWTQSLELYQSCLKFKGSFAVIPTQVRFLIPYMTILIQNSTSPRLVGLSMEGFNLPSGSTLFLMDSKQNLIWSEDPLDYLKNSLQDVGYDFLKFTQWVSQNLNQKELQQTTTLMKDMSDDGILVSTLVKNDWQLFLLSYRPSVMQPIHYAIQQAILLIISFLFFSLFIGKKASEWMLKPIYQLKNSAERIGMGHFDEQFIIEGQDEISSVKIAFNVMISKIRQMITDVKIKSELESHLANAEQIQKFLLPEDNLQTVNHFIYNKLYSNQQPEGCWLGYLEIVRQDKLPLLLLIATDAFGKGVAPALILSTLRGGLSTISFQTAFSEEFTFNELTHFLQKLNTLIYEMASGRFSVPIFAALLDPEETMIYIMNAGFPKNYLFIPNTSPSELEDQNEDKELLIIKSNAPDLGKSPESIYKNIQKFPWQPESKLIIHTRGWNEIKKNGKLVFGEKEIQAFIKKNKQLKSQNFFLKLVKEHQKISNQPINEKESIMILCEAKKFF